MQAGVSRHLRSFAAALALLCLAACAPVQRDAVGTGGAPQSGLEAQLQAYDDAARLSSTPLVKLENLFRKATTLNAALRRDDAIATYRALVTDWGSSEEEEIRNYVVASVLNIGHAQRAQRKPDAAEASYDDALRRLAGATTPAARRYSLSASVYKAEMQIERKAFSDAEALLRSAAGTYCGERVSLMDAACVRTQRNIAWAQEQQGQHEAALATLDTAAERHRSQISSEVWQELSVVQMRRGLLMHNRFKKPDEAIAAYDESVRVGILADTPTARYWAAFAQMNKGILLGGQGKRTEAVRAIDELLIHFEPFNDTGLTYPIVRGLITKAQNLQMLNRLPEASQTYDAAMAKLGEPQPGSQTELLGSLLLGKGRLQLRQKQTDDAIATFDRVTARFASSPDTRLRDIAGQAASAKAVALDTKRNNDRFAQGIADLDGRLRQAASEPEPRRSQSQATLSLLKAGTYVSMGMHDEAIAIYDDIYGRFAAAADETLRYSAINGRYLKALAQNQQGQPSEAARSLRELLERHRDAQPENIRQVLRRAEDWLQKNPQPDQPS